VLKKAWKESLIGRSRGKKKRWSHVRPGKELYAGAVLESIKGGGGKNEDFFWEKKGNVERKARKKAKREKKKEKKNVIPITKKRKKKERSIKYIKKGHSSAKGKREGKGRSIS